jgi:hypothetical protein
MSDKDTKKPKEKKKNIPKKPINYSPDRTEVHVERDCSYSPEEIIVVEQ